MVESLFYHGVVEVRTKVSMEVCLHVAMEVGSKVSVQQVCLHVEMKVGNQVTMEVCPHVEMEVGNKVMGRLLQVLTSRLLQLLTSMVELKKWMTHPVSLPWSLGELFGN